MFDKYSGKYIAEKKAIEKHLASCQNQGSNLERSLDSEMSYAGKLIIMRDSADYSQKQQLQNLIFPDSMYYSKKRRVSSRKRKYCIPPKVPTGDGL